MIPRYTRERIGAVWTQQRRMETWLQVELAATEAWAAEGVVPAEAAKECRSKASFRVEAFVDVLQVKEASRDQAGTCEKAQRHGDLGHDDRRAGPLM